MTLRIGLIGDFNPGITAHRAIPLALQQAAAASGTDCLPVWLPTEAITHPGVLAGFAGLWCTPGSPYRSMDGALRAIRHARESGLPFMGTCGGFQHALIEYARHVLGWDDAEHAETAPQASRAVVAALACPLVEAEASVHPLPGSKLADLCGSSPFMARYHCRYGLNPALAPALLNGPLRVGGVDADGEVRAVELTGHPFFIATLFQHERAALADQPVPLVAAFLQHCQPFATQESA